MIPHAEKLYIDGMGHDMPSIYMDQYHAAILKQLNTVPTLVEQSNRMTLRQSISE